MIQIKSIRETDIRNKRVFIRVDFNVPLQKNPDNPNEWIITDDTRITQALPTIKYAISQGSKIILASHLGRPKGKINPDFSLLPCAKKLSQLLEIDVTLAEECVGEGIEVMSKRLGPGQILLLENLRFHGEEESNDPKFSLALSRLCDVYINDAFGTAHRKHSSTYGMAELIPIRAVGLLIEKEISFLNQLIHTPKSPYYLVLGGAKVSDKIQTIEFLIKSVDGVVIGGAMAYSFMKAKGLELPKNAKSPTDEDISCAHKILKLAQRKNIPILLPVDTIDSFDIGPKTIETFSDFLQNAKTIFWNGPMGWFEKPEYAKGTLSLAEKVAHIDCLKVIGGGDTVAAIVQSGFSEKYNHLSTGGGAVLEFLEGNGLPGIDILRGVYRGNKQ